MTNEKAIKQLKAILSDYWDDMRDTPSLVKDDVDALRYAITALERDTPKRVGMSEWKGYRNTRYKCPGCGKNARNDETYCHKCGQRWRTMLIESEYLKEQIREMAEVADENDPGEPCALHHAYNMVRVTLNSIAETIHVIEQYTRRADNGGGD